MDDDDDSDVIKNMIIKLDLNSGIIPQYIPWELKDAFYTL